jgi:succinoglycan biosynthesis transport protein ExoP
MDILSGNRFRKLISSARETFDFVILDTPPIIPVGDTLTLKGKIDGFLFLFRLEYTPHTLLKQAIEEIGEKSVIGVVLNGVEPERFQYYQRYYGKYYKGSTK